MSALVRFVARRRTTFRSPARGDVTTLEPEAREVARLVWQRRHANERASVELAMRMRATATALHLGEVEQALARLAEDEAAHVEATGIVLDVLETPRPPAARTKSPAPGERRELSFARDIVVGLALCESVSAARFAKVRAATDIPVFRAIIDAFLRDEVAHAALGMELVVCAREQVRAVIGPDAEPSWLVAEVLAALVDLERVLGLDGARRGLAPARPQPPNNPGVVEPNLDAHAFYDVVDRRVLPRLEASGLRIRAAWERRFARVYDPAP